MVSSNRPYPFKFFKGCLPQNLLSLLLNTLSIDEECGIIALGQGQNQY